MIETAKQQERAILVGVELQETEHFDMSMEELASLAKTAGAEVVASYTQKRERYGKQICNDKQNSQQHMRTIIITHINDSDRKSVV